MPVIPTNVERSAFRPGEYVGWDTNGERYRIFRYFGERRGWWVHPQTTAGRPGFSAYTLRHASIVLFRVPLS